MHTVVKILSSHDGEPREKDSQHWCLAINKTGSQTLCEGEFFGFGESGCDFKVKTVKRGGITCPKCLYEIKLYKSIKL